MSQQVFSGTVAEAAARLGDGPAFMAQCVRSYNQSLGRPPGAAERRSWEHSWPALLKVLRAAGLNDVHLLLEYLLPGSSERVDALLVGSRRDDGRLLAVAIELKQWSHAQPQPGAPGMVVVGERESQHPSRQVGGYVNYLRGWTPTALELEVRGLSYLHNAPPPLIAGLRRHVAGGPSAAFPLFGAEDLEHTAATELTERLRCADLVPAPPKRITAFLDAPHRPSTPLLLRVASDIAGNERFRLVGEQDKAALTIRKAIHDGGRGRVVAVTGGPGTGKTVVATQVFRDLCESAANPRLLTPSGTLTRQLQRAVGTSAKGLIDTLGTRTPRGLDRNASVVLLDEAHRARTFRHQRRGESPQILEKLLDSCAVLVLFLDERQIIRPDEGTTLEELRRLAARSDSTFAHVELTSQFRCGGSLGYLDWVDALLEPEPVPRKWSAATDYHLAVAGDPAVLEEWVTTHVAEGRSARMTAGFCWPWDREQKPPLKSEISLTWRTATGERTRHFPWNAGREQVRADADTPGRPYWATDEGGHRQIGCVYTAQGMEYDFGAVVLGDDLVWRNGRWLGRPGNNHDSAVRHLPAEDFLPYALNIYRVLMTRGMRGTRLYSTDDETQSFLHSLVEETHDRV